MTRFLVAILFLAAPTAVAGDALGNVGTVRGDYWTRFNDLELNVVLSAIPILDVELLPATDSWVASDDISPPGSGGEPGR